MPATDNRTKAQLLAALRDMKRQAEDQRADLEEREARMEKKLDRAMSSLAARDPPADHQQYCYDLQDEGMEGRGGWDESGYEAWDDVDDDPEDDADDVPGDLTDADDADDLLTEEPNTQTTKPPVVKPATKAATRVAKPSPRASPKSPATSSEMVEAVTAAVLARLLPQLPAPSKTPDVPPTPKLAGKRRRDPRVRHFSIADNGGCGRPIRGVHGGARGLFLGPHA